MDLELYSLRIFCEVVKEKTFSGAARSLKITQPSVSQQIAKLEGELTAKLFERIGHDIRLTQTGREFHQFAVELLERADRFSETLRDQKSLPSGLVRYAMPESCQWTPHYRHIMSQIKDYPEIHFMIDVLPSEEIIKKLREGLIDFGFVIGERISPELRFQKFSDEKYSAVGSTRDLFRPLQNPVQPENLRLVTYPGWEPLFTLWAKTHGIWKAAKQKLASPTIQIGTLAGAIHAIQAGAGMGIIPTHCVDEELRSGRLFEWKSSKPVQVMSPIYIARRIGETLPKRVELIMDMLKKAKDQH